MNPDEAIKIKEEASNLLNQGLFQEGYEKFLCLGVDEFLKYTLVRKKSTSLQKPFFWESFILQVTNFDLFFNSIYAEKLLFFYFKKQATISSEFEELVALQHPDLMVKVIRLSQLFLDENRIEDLINLKLFGVYSSHQSTWAAFQNAELELWNCIESEMNALGEFPVHQVLIFLVEWLEESRFNDSSNQRLTYLADNYEFFISLYLNKYESNVIETDLTKWDKHLIYVLTDKKINPLNSLMDAIDRRTKLYHDLISRYCFDSDFTFFNESGRLDLTHISTDKRAKWENSDHRIELITTLYYQEALQAVERNEKNGSLYIPHSKNGDGKELNREVHVNYQKSAYILKDLCIENFIFNSISVKSDKVIHPLIGYANYCNQRYVGALNSRNTINWKSAYLPIMIKSAIKDIRNEPYLLNTISEYIDLNKQVFGEGFADNSKSIIDLFSFNIDGNEKFDRFQIQYNVWYRPFLKIQNVFFSPMLFFASNDWFYAIVNAALINMANNKDEGKRTSNLMEKHLCNKFSAHNRTVRRIEDEEANDINGDIDLIVQDKTATVLIQLKRTYLRTNLEEIYNERVNSDEKAMEQLNDGHEWLENNSDFFIMDHKPTKWIVSTSFEDILSNFNGCRKVNYFELLFILVNRRKETGTLSELIDFVESDNLIREIMG
ncbi:MAG: hypothetical protein GQ574_25430 [Crocinitomix sp.]|nr:hypothetical protein [Crocinitomix sp.]